MPRAAVVDDRLLPQLLGHNGEGTVEGRTRVNPEGAGDPLAGTVEP